ncbi:MAG: Re/Si-specific NAD(P)(+) transhydrogenase subunit alpha [Phycisphaerales bacterium]|nr:Re/Si-specific NAD(P)(+) transhydrogenase subunit alpha [Phycisphaerales bacterium]
MKLGILKEMLPDETRVAVTPEMTKKFVPMGIEIVVEAGAGLGAAHDDAAYREAGATVSDNREQIWAESDLVCCINPPAAEDAAHIREGAALLCHLQPVSNLDLIRTLVDRKATGLSFDQVPRITRAQKIDSLSAMGSIAGYKAVVLAADATDKYFPMLMTAAGTVTPAKVFVIGAGVAGLMAVATAKRLGAVVEGYDVRPDVKEQVESLGGKFIEFEIESAVGEGGYAKEQTADQLKKQQDAMRDHIAGVDIVITTAMVPGRPAPKIITQEMVEGMRLGAVIVDLAAQTGGNCVLTKPGETVVHNGVKILGPLNLAATMPFHASGLFGRIVGNLLVDIVEEGELKLDMEDEVVDGMAITHAGEVRHAQTKEALSEGGAT